MPSSPRSISLSTARKRLERLSTLCLALPEARVERAGDHATFRVRGKPFCYFLHNHHGDGILAACFRAAPGENRDWVKHDPGRFYLPAYIGARGWFGVRLDSVSASWLEIQDFAMDSYRLAAPAVLVRKRGAHKGASAAT